MSRAPDAEGDELPPAAWAAALSGLPAMGPARLAAVLGEWEPAEAWQVVAGGRVLAAPAVAQACRPDAHGVAAAWARAAVQADVAETWRALGRAGVRVLIRGHAGYPADLVHDHEAPGVLFARGDPEVLAARRVAVVGTRQCTRYGADLARELGHDLAAAGVAVVSGLALGIDGAVHAGALEAGGRDAGAAPPVAVVGSGLDVVYPRRHTRLWEAVGERGLLLSEAPLGARPEPWRFPVRNRVIAALAEAVVVVESHVRGGSLHTVDAALARDRPVLAVPGSVRSSASTFPNTLLADGCAPVRDALDVLVVLRLSSCSTPPSPQRPPPAGEEAAVLTAVGWEPATLDEVVARSGLSPRRAGLLLARLEDDGWLVGRAGWWERLAGPGTGSKS